MKKSTPIIVVLSVCALLLASFAVVSPKSVRAAIATLIRDSDNAGRHPFSGFCISPFASGQGTTPVSCQIAVPSGEEVVIQSTSVFGFSPANSVVVLLNSTVSGQSATDLYVLQTSPGMQVAFGAPFTEGDIVQADVNFSDTRSLTLYADQNTPISCGVVGAQFASCQVEGYFVTLP
jgi:hypothetical protein